MITPKQVRSALLADSYSVNDGVFTLRWGYFYSRGVTVQDKINYVLEKFPKVKIIDSGNNWKPFRGGATLRNQSHFFVSFSE